MSNNHLNFAKKLKDDEYYTRRFLVDLIFSKTVEVLGTKNVLYVLAADSDRSFYTKYAQTHKLNFINNIDLYNASLFMYSNGWTSCIITNPPFSQLINWLKEIQPVVEVGGLQLCLIVPITTLSTASMIYYLQHCYFYPFNGKMNIFFHGFELKSVNTMLMTTFKLNDWPVNPKQPVPPTGDTFTTPVTRIIYKSYYEACGYHLVGVDPNRGHNLFKRYIWEKNKNNPN